MDRKSVYAVVFFCAFMALASTVLAEECPIDQMAGKYNLTEICFGKFDADGNVGDPLCDSEKYSGALIIRNGQWAWGIKEKGTENDPQITGPAVLNVNEECKKTPSGGTKCFFTADDGTKGAYIYYPGGRIGLQIYLPKGFFGIYFWERAGGI